MPLTTDEQTTLTNLQAAYDKLISGQQVAMTQEGQSRTQWTPGNQGALLERIAALQAKAASSTSRTRGAISFRVGHRGNY